MLARRSLCLLVSLFLGGAMSQSLHAQEECYWQYAVSVAAVGSGDTADTYSTGNVVRFTVTNTSPSQQQCQDVYDLTATATGPVTVDAVSPTTLYSWRGQVDTVDVIFTAGSVGSGSVQLKATGLADDDSASIGVTVVEPHGPRIVMADHQSYRDVTRCIANCFDAVVSYSTPPYYSQDTPRSVRLMYRSSSAYPMGFVSAWVWDTTNVPPAKMSIRLKDASGAWVTFTNNTTEYFFACDSTGASVACVSPFNRLAVQFDASSKATGSYAYTLVVRSYRPNGSFGESQTKIRVLIENETSSPIGAGWTIAGHQHLWGSYADSVVITDGNGSIGFFALASPKPCFPCSYTSPAGDFSTLTLGTIDDGAVYKRVYPDGTTVGFHATGWNLWVRDAHGSKTTYDYDGSGRLVRVRDVAERDDSLGYSFGKLRWVKDPGGRTDSILVDGSGNLTQIKDAAGGLPFQGTYNALHRLTRVVDRRGGARGIAYDFAGKIKADTAPPIGTAHGSGERPVVRYGSLESAVLSDTALHVGTSASPATPASDQTVRATVTNPRGFTTAYTLNNFGQPFRIEQPQGRTSQFKYWLGLKTRDSFPEGQGHVLRYTWTGANLTKWEDSTAQRTINYTYDTTYNILTKRWGAVDSLVNWLTSDKKNIDSSRIGGAARSTDYNYLATPYHHHSCTVSGPSTGYWSSCRFPSSSGLQNTDSVVTTRITTYPGPSYWIPTRYQYDSHGQRVRTINAVGDTTWTQYDAVGRVTRVIGPQHDTTSYTYGDSLYLTQVQDARGQVYKVWPNALGWPDSTADPAGKVMRFTYDSVGNQVGIVNRRGQTIQFTYDSLGVLRLKIVGTDTTKYFSDPLGRYRAVANGESVDTVKLDAAGRPWVEIACRVLVSGGGYQCFRDSLEYDVRNLRTKLMVTAPGLWSTHTVTYHYNTHMQLDTLTNFTGQKEVFTHGGELHDSTRKFVALNNLTLTHGRAAYTAWNGHSASLTFSDTMLTNWVGLAYGYDTLSRVTTYQHGKLATPDTIRSFVDSAGRLFRSADTAYTWTSAACTLGSLGASCDPTKVSTKNGVGTPATFYYDSLGNPKDSPAQGYGVDPGNRLRRLGFVRMDYDFDGNLTRKRILNLADTTKVVSTDSLFWNALGQLDSLHRADSTGAQILRITWGYDGYGRQVRQSVDGNTVHFLWDGDVHIFKLDTLGGRLAYWTYYPSTPKAQSVAFTTAAPFTIDTTLYYVSDVLNNTVALLKSHAGGWQLRNEFRYGPFGDSLAVTGTGANVAHLQYKGAYYDGYTGLYRMGVRYYDPDVGRFISEDPLGLEAGLNQYAFAGTDAVNGYDPSGQFAWFALVPMALFGSVTAAEVLVGGATLGAALVTALEVVSVTALTSHISATIQAATSERQYFDAFQENFTSSAAFLGLNLAGAALLGAYEGAGINGLQAYIKWKKPPVTIMIGGRNILEGGFTFGPASAFTAPLHFSVRAGGALAAHELGHTIQFLGLSALGKFANPWRSYLALGAIGLTPTLPGKLWEQAASRLGGLAGGGFQR